MNDPLSPSLAPRYGWASLPPNGLKWAFLQRQGDEPAILSMTGVDPVCIRTPKMARVEAALLVSDGPLSARKVMQLATLADVGEAKRLIDRLNLAYDTDGTAFRIERVASGYRMLTRPQFAFWLGKLHHRQAELKLSPPALETLAIVAYRQPMTRAELESIRRVQCADMLKQLMDRGLVRIGGEENSLGRPFLYETTRQFLELFGLHDLDSLPKADVLPKPKAVATPTPDPEEADPEHTQSAA